MHELKRQNNTCARFLGNVKTTTETTPQRLLASRRMRDAFVSQYATRRITKIEKRPRTYRSNENDTTGLIVQHASCLSHKLMEWPSGLLNV